MLDWDSEIGVVEKVNGFDQPISGNQTVGSIAAKHRERESRQS